MATMATAIGRGIQEYGNPNSVVEFTGIPLNQWNTSNIKNDARIWNPDIHFDLTGMNKGVGACVCLINFYSVWEETGVNVKWRKKSNGVLVADQNVIIADPRAYGYQYWDWYWCYFPIGYLDNEINENGTYLVEIAGGGHVATWEITITGIPYIEPPIIPPITNPHSIPTWLFTALQSMHWQILTFYIDAGTPVINAINWVLDQADNIKILINNVSNSVMDLSNQVSSNYTSLMQSITDNIDTLRTVIFDTSNNFQTTLINLSVNTNNRFSFYDTIIDNISRTFASLTVVSNLITNLENSFNASLYAVKDNMYNTVLSLITPIKNMVNEHTLELLSIKEFLDNPFNWLLNKFYDWFLGGK